MLHLGLRQVPYLVGWRVVHARRGRIILSPRAPQRIRGLSASLHLGHWLPAAALLLEPSVYSLSGKQVQQVQQQAPQQQQAAPSEATGKPS